MRWDKHIEMIRDSKWSAVNLTNVENYCRDLFNFGFLWCYIDSPSQSEEWEPCNPEGRIIIFSRFPIILRYILICK